MLLSWKWLIFCALLLAVAVALRMQGQTTWGNVLLGASIGGLLAAAFHGTKAWKRGADNDRS